MGRFLSVVRAPWAIAALAAATVALLGMRCSDAADDKPPADSSMPDSVGDSSVCPEPECSPGEYEEHSRYRCDDCGQAYWASYCPLRCEPCENDEVFWTPSGLPCYCIGDDGLNNHEPGCDPDYN